MGGVFFQYSNVLSQGISFLGFHQEVASGPFCLLVNSPWPLVFILCVFFFFLSGFNLYCWKGVHFSWSLDLNFCLFFFGLITSLHFWLRVWRWNRMDIISTIKHFFHEFITFKYSFHGLWIINVGYILMSHIS